MSNKLLSTKNFQEVSEIIKSADDGGCKGCVFHSLDLQGKPCGNCISGLTPEQIGKDALADTGEDNRISIVDLLDLAMGL